jgi:hypothetical protein
MPSVTAQDLPPEVVYHIVRGIRDDWGATISWLSDRLLSKKGIAACSLACRYWVELLRPVLFRDLTLRGTDDILGLLDIFEAPVVLGRPPAYYLTALRLEVDQCDLVASEWVHHISRLSWHIRFGLELDLDVKLATSADTSPNRLVQNYLPLSRLPRTLPRSFFKIPYGFRSITVNGLQLGRATELVRFIDSLPTRQTQCHFRRVSFIDGIKTLDAILFRRRPRNPPPSWTLFHVTMSRCHDDQLFTQLLLAGYVSATRERLSLDKRAWEWAMKSIASLLPATWGAASIMLDPIPSDKGPRVSAHAHIMTNPPHLAELIYILS